VRRTRQRPRLKKRGRMGAKGRGSGTTRMRSISMTIDVANNISD
jgi:hypothetical protein